MHLSKIIKNSPQFSFLLQMSKCSGWSRYISCLHAVWYLAHSVAWSSAEIMLTLFDMMTSSNEKFSALLALCAGNPPVTGGFPSQRPVTRSLDVFFALRLYKRLSKNWDAGDLRRNQFESCDEGFHLHAVQVSRDDKKCENVILRASCKTVVTPVLTLSCAKLSCYADSNQFSW